MKVRLFLLLASARAFVSTRSGIRTRSSARLARHSDDSDVEPWLKLQPLLSRAATAIVGVGLGLSTFAVHPALAEEKRSVAEIAGSGLIFKDTLVVDAFADPKVEGVTIYVSDFQRPITDRLKKDFFSDPSQADITWYVLRTRTRSHTRCTHHSFRSVRSHSVAACIAP